MSLEALFSTDPSVFLPPGDSRLLPEAWDPQVWRRPAVDGLLTWADRLAAEPDTVLPFSLFLRFFQDGDRQGYEQAYFHRRRRLEIFALAVLSGRGDRFLTGLQDCLAAVCEEYSWALPAHVNPPAFPGRESLLPTPERTIDLFAAETASALAEIRSLLGPRLPSELLRRIDDQIDTRVWKPFLESPWSWEAATHNWAAVCAGGVGLTALWTKEPEILASVLPRLGRAFDAYLSGFPSDGLCLEGMGYWTYGFGYFVAFAELLKNRSRGTLDLLGHPELTDRLTTIAAFPDRGRLGNRDFARFSDALDEYRYPPGTVTRLRLRLGVPRPLDPALAEDLAYDPCARWARHLRDFLWTEPSVPPREEDPSVAWYPASQWLIARGTLDGWNVGLAAKGGHNDEPHNHNDIGSFQLVVAETTYLDDLGAGRYDRGYFGPGRYAYFVNSSRSHSVPWVGRDQATGPAHRASNAQFLPSPFPQLSLDLSAAYPDSGLISLVRSWTLTPGSVLPIVITDVYQFEDTQVHAVTERFVTRLPVRVEAGRVVLEGPEALLILEPQSAPQVVSVLSEVYAPHEGEDRTAFCIDFHHSITSGASLSVRLTLVPKGSVP